MTDRQNCSNCGAPITRNGNETRVTCPHCQTANEFASAGGGGGGGGRGHDRYDNDDSGNDGVPNIVIIQTGPTVVESGSSTYVRRRSPMVSLFSTIFFLVIFIGVFAYIRMRATKMAESVEHQVEKAEKSAEKAGEKPHEKPHH